MTRRLAGAALLALAGCAGTGERMAAAEREAGAVELARAVEGRVVGPPQQCIDGINLQGPQVIGPDTLVYREGARTFVNRIEGCPSLHGDPVLVVEQYGSRLCRNDRFRTIQRGGGTIPGPVCRFGMFTPYARAR